MDMFNNRPTSGNPIPSWLPLHQHQVLITPHPLPPGTLFTTGPIRYMWKTKPRHEPATAWGHLRFRCNIKFMSGVSPFVCVNRMTHTQHHTDASSFPLLPWLIFIWMTSKEKSMITLRSFSLMKGSWMTVLQQIWFPPFPFYMKASVTSWTPSVVGML